MNKIAKRVIEASGGPADGTLDRFRGCLLGGAVGDALGAPVEFLSRAEILEQYGPAGVAGYAPAYGGLGRITDDTQMTLFTAEGLLQGWQSGCEDGSGSLVQATRRAYLNWLQTQEADAAPAPVLDAVPVASRLLQQGELYSRRGPGETCLASLRAARASDAPVENDRKGCGGLMRVAPAGLFFWRPLQACSPRPAFRLAAELAGLTHGHPTGQLAAGVLAVLVLSLVDGMRLPQALAIAKQILASQPGHEETLRAIEHAECLARSPIRRPEAIAALGEGWLAEEALAIAVYCALVSQAFEEGVVLAVNHDGDSDSTGAITGQLLGALHGVEAIPPQWLEPLELRALISETADQLHGYWSKSSDEAPRPVATAP
ncbi:MAG TPA: ADP-ribosylglycohydrolase family protein [Gammaproteobacteria bacterium]|nr:ADP-ribosylglycohydrolase family protein [Gammaproteobacteria bacterium]